MTTDVFDQSAVWAPAGVRDRGGNPACARGLSVGVEVKIGIHETGHSRACTACGRRTKRLTGSFQRFGRELRDPKRKFVAAQSGRSNAGQRIPRPRGRCRALGLGEGRYGHYYAFGLRRQALVQEERHAGGLTIHLRISSRINWLPSTSRIGPRSIAALFCASVEPINFAAIASNS